MLPGDDLIDVLRTYGSAAWVAEQLGITRDAVQKWFARGRVPDRQSLGYIIDRWPELEPLALEMLRKQDED